MNDQETMYLLVAILTLMTVFQVIAWRRINLHSRVSTKLIDELMGLATCQNNSTLLFMNKLGISDSEAENAIKSIRQQLDREKKQ